MALTKKEREEMRAAGYQWHAKSGRWLKPEEIEKQEQMLDLAGSIETIGTFVLAAVAFIAMLVMLL